MIEGKKIVGYLDDNANVSEYEDYQDNRIIPCICDTHNYLCFEGVTSCLPTVTDTIKYVAKVAKGSYKGARVLSIHSEDQYLNRVGENGRPEPHPDVGMAKFYVID